MSHRRGFVYIEFLCHLALVAISLSLIIVHQHNAYKNLLVKVAQQELVMIKMGIMSYRDHKTPPAYPPKTDSLCAQVLTRANPLVIRRVFYDPFSRSGQEYQYAVSPGGKHFCLWSVGKDRVSCIRGIDDQGSVAKSKNCDDIYLSDLLDSF